MMRVLIADDHPLMLSGIEAVLRGTAYEVVAKLRDGASVLQQLAEAKPDLLILDVNMPERSGIDVLRTLRCRGDTRPIILLTGDLNDGALMEALELEVNGIIMKEGAESLILTCLAEVRGGGRWIERSVLQRALAITMSGAAEPESRLAQLPPRERAIARLVSEGLRNKDIADELGLTEGTVKVTLHRIYEKLDVGNRTELALLAREELPS